MNARKEFLDEIKGRKLVCAKIGIDVDWPDNKKWFVLKNKYNDKDFDDFCSQIDIEYDAGYGSQELFGMILFDDSYSDRGEYDGSEWWENHKMPTVENIMNIDEEGE